MKEYQAPQCIVWEYGQDVITTSTSMEACDDTGKWIKDWSKTGEEEE